ncbi:hypothetical protein [Allosalinactinospora lopnorensis]|uniref:hypothetical protein n=1 Tax=Allosalinactinospora lopnorensis TaxID=1352348 RepID=UPI000623D5F0|nr:hypothetical protein [Allosalinactinospora lopnorensis]
MSEPIVYIDRSEIREGKLEEVRKAAAELADFVDTHEPQLLSYGFYINEEAGRMTVVAVHPDSASLELHMEVAGPVFRKFADLIELRAIEAYGRLSDKALSGLHQKALMLGENGSVVVDEPYAGFTRFESAGS